MILPSTIAHDHDFPFCILLTQSEQLLLRRVHDDGTVLARHLQPLYLSLQPASPTVLGTARVVVKQDVPHAVEPQSPIVDQAEVAENRLSRHQEAARRLSTHIEVARHTRPAVVQLDGDRPHGLRRAFESETTHNPTVRTHLIHALWRKRRWWGHGPRVAVSGQPGVVQCLWMTAGAKAHILQRDSFLRIDKQETVEEVLCLGAQTAVVAVCCVVTACSDSLIGMRIIVTPKGEGTRESSVKERERRLHGIRRGTDRPHVHRLVVVRVGHDLRSPVHASAHTSGHVLLIDFTRVPKVDEDDVGQIVAVC